MKLIKVIIKPFKLEELKNALIKIGVTGITVIEVRGFSRQKSQFEETYPSYCSTDLIPKIMLEMAISEQLLPKAIDIITQIAKTEKSGDGKIFVLPLEEVISIRTEERGEKAI